MWSAVRSDEVRFNRIGSRVSGIAFAAPLTELEHHGVSYALVCHSSAVTHIGVDYPKDLGKNPSAAERFIATLDLRSKLGSREKLEGPARGTLPRTVTKFN